MHKTLCLRHVGIYTKDFEAMVRFYRDVLELKELLNYVDNSEYISILLEQENVSVRICKLITENGEKTGQGDMIELLGIENQTMDLKYRKLFDPGLSHIALETDHIFELYQQIISSGGRKVREPVCVKENGNWVAFCCDIEGNYLELIQRKG